MSKVDRQLLYLQKYKRVEAQFSLKFYTEEHICIINQHIKIFTRRLWRFAAGLCTEPEGMCGFPIRPS